MIDPLIDLPVDLQERYATWSFDEVYHHVPGRATYRLDGVEETRFVKIISAEDERILMDEVVRLRWAAEWLPVPRLVEHGTDGERSWLMTLGLPGVDASRHPWCREDPDRLAATLGAALRGFHDGVPVGECPFELPLAPDDDDPVVLHGDFCLPNVLLTGDVVTGVLDLGRLGIGDRWWDLALGSWSLTYNCGPGHEDAFFAAYGVAADHERIARHRAAYAAMP